MNMVPMHQQGAGSSGVQHYSRIECGGCHTQLMYPPGSANVRCARCGVVTPSLPPQALAGNDMAQLTCSNQGCRLPIMYPRGARLVQGSVCGTLHDSMAANAIGHVICDLCHITLMYAYGAQSVKCAVCNHVTPTDPSSHPSAAGMARQGSTAAQNPPKPPTQTVVVENPATLDEQGNEVPNYAVGTTREVPKASAT